MRIGACDGAPVFAVAELTDNRQVANVFSRKQSRPHFLNINTRLDNQKVRSRLGKCLSLFAENVIGVVEFQITKRRNEFTRRTDRAGNFGLSLRGFFGNLDGGKVQIANTVGKPVVSKLETRRAESVRLDNGCARFDISAVNPLHNVGGVYVHEFGTRARLETASLEHRAHCPIKNFYHVLSSVKIFSIL